MPVIIERAGAAHLAAEGATCLDANQATATRDGCPVPWPAGSRRRCHLKDRVLAGAS